MALFLYVEDAAAALADLAGGAELEDEFVEDAVDEELASVAGEFLGELDVLVDGYALGDGWAFGEFGDGHVDEEDVHEGDALEFPAFEVFADEVIVFVAMAQGDEEELACEVEAFALGLVAFVVDECPWGGFVHVVGVECLEVHE